MSKDVFINIKSFGDCDGWGKWAPWNLWCFIIGWRQSLRTVLICVSQTMPACKQLNRVTRCPHCRGQRFSCIFNLLCIMISVSHKCRFWVIAHPCSQSGVWIFALVTLATVSPDQMLQMWKNLISSQVWRWWYVSMSSSSVFFFNLTNYPEQCILRSLIYLCFRRTLCLQPWWSWLETAPSPQ